MLKKLSEKKEKNAKGFTLIQLDTLDSLKEQRDEAVTPAKKTTPSKKKVPSEDAPLRWAMLTLYLTISTALTFTCIALVAALNN